MREHEGRAPDVLVDAVKVPAGHKVAMETVGVGEITYECRDKANPAIGSGTLTGVAPASDCSPANKGVKEIVKYQANYIFWKAA